jgi:hypothetical protein
MIRPLFYLIVVVTLMSLNSCKDESTTSLPDLPVKTINYDYDSTTGYWHFYTNDTAYCSSTGGGAYHHIFDSVYTPFDSVETEVVKYSGSDYMYGIEYCIQTGGDFYRLLISTEGVYEVFKHVNGINSWYNFNTSAWSLTNNFNYPVSSALHHGFGVFNKLKVVATGSGNFDVYFNGIKSASFNDNSFTGGKVGLVTYVGTKTDERFPNYPVDVKFKQIVAN